MRQYSVGDTVRIVNQYTGRLSGNYTVCKVSPTGKKVTICKPEFKTGCEVFNYQPTFNRFHNDYSGTMHPVR